MTLLENLNSLADHLTKKAQAENCDTLDAVKIFKELREFYAILTKGDEKGDKEPGRRPTTISAMRERIALVSGGEMDDAGTAE
jgi:hypothetical protein